MADLFGNNNDNFDLGSSSSGSSADKLKIEEVQKVIMMEQQKAQLNAQVKYCTCRNCVLIFFFLISFLIIKLPL
jgi:hypothetical protein